MNSVPRLLLPTLVFSLLPTLAQAQGSDSPPPAPLPVRAVSLFTSGVSYIERAGTVDGNAAIALSFPTDQINDLLKSLVLLDTHGTVQPVTYGTRDPIGRSLQSFAIDVSQPTSRADLLQKLRGARVSVVTNANATLTGQIVGVETRTERRPDGTTTDNISTLDLLTDAGLQAVDLKDTRSIQILDPRLNAEFKQALSVLASGADTARRPVTLHFAGSGRREVRVGYVAEAPLWKVSYRLLVGGADAKEASVPTGSSYLQGWALVENTTDDDWNGVHLSLVSGRPVSFIQDLYQPLYIPRPVVPPDVVASPYPQTHGSSLEPDQLRAAPEGQLLDENGAPGQAAAAAPAPVMALPPAPPRREARKAFTPSLVPGQGSVSAQAQGASVGEQYAYDVSVPVSLPRQQAAMIPIVAQNIAGAKVLLYNADSDPKFPLDAVRLHNTTKLHLKGGPVTLFDGGTYAGDARMDDVSPGETRLITYAVDLSVQGDRKTDDQGSVRFSLSLHRGILEITRRNHTETAYSFKSQAAGPRTLLIEQAYQAGDVLVQPAQADERTADVLRFALPIQPGKTAMLTVVTERPLSSEIGVFDADLDEIGVYAANTSISGAQRETLQSIIRQRREIDTLRSEAQQRTQNVTSFTSDQERIRKNMQALDKGSALYKRYANELDAQETQIQRLRAEAAALSAKADAASNALRASLDTLTF